MPNLFIDTSYRRSEEDRLTNALMALLEHCDRRVLSQFVALCGAENVALTTDTPVEFELQPTFDQSRPDALISLPNLSIYIETKRDDSLEREQFRRHWSHLAEHCPGPAVLVALTGSRVAPVLVSEVAQEQTRDDLRAHHVSWSDWLGTLVALQGEFDSDTATGLLLRQLEEYLRSLGYWHFDGPPVDRVLDYGDTLRRLWGHHNDRTRPYLQQRLTKLMEQVRDAVPERDDWTLQDWGKSGVFSNGNYGIAYFECVLDELGPKTRYRVSLNVRESGKLRLSYYLTMWHTEPHFEALGGWLIERTGDFQSLAPFNRFDFWTDRRGFHCSKIVEQESLHQFLNGDDSATDVISAQIAELFVTLDSHLNDFERDHLPN